MLVIGGGPAGLTVATYLARFRRRVCVVDGGKSRAGWIPVSHNMIGFPDGISGTDLLGRLREQARKYGAEIIEGEARRLERHADARFVATLTGAAVEAPRVRLATGGLDVEPELPGIRDAVRRGLVRYCPICEADEDGALIVRDHQRTSVEGLYAAGDVVRGLSQISVAAGQAAVARRT